MKNIGALSLTNLCSLFMEKGDVGAEFNIPLEYDSKNDPHWYESYDFSKPTKDSINLIIMNYRRYPSVDGDSYNGDETRYLLKIDGMIYIFNNDDNSWSGPENPTLHIANIVTAYNHGDTYFEVDIEDES